MCCAVHTGAFSIKFLIKFISPVIPDWIEDAREYLQIRSESDLKIDLSMAIPTVQLVALPALPKPSPRAGKTVANPVAASATSTPLMPTKSAAQVRFT
jgi:hypothetical protein